MISMSQDRHTAGIVKVTLFADTYTEMMDAYNAFPNYSSHYNANIEKHTLRFAPNHNGRKQWVVHASYWTSCE